MINRFFGGIVSKDKIRMIFLQVRKWELSPKLKMVSAMCTGQDGITMLFQQILRIDTVGSFPTFGSSIKN